MHTLTNLQKAFGIPDCHSEQMLPADTAPIEYVNAYELVLCTLMTCTTGA